jgi:nitrite transporter
LWMSARIANEAARMVAIAWCLFAFIASGYEHSIANMTIFGVALFSNHPETVTWAGMMWNLFWVTLGNTIAGSVFMAGAYWLASKKPAASLAPRVEPAE